MDLFGSPNFKRMADEHDHDGLYRLLEHRNKLIRLQAAQTLAEMNDGAGWRYLLDTVRQKGDADTQMVAAAMLGELGHPRAVPVLAEARMYQTRGLLQDSHYLAACQKLLGEADGTKLATGSREEKLVIIGKWLPQPP